jgi:hypothetical protein
MISAMFLVIIALSGLSLKPPLEVSANEKASQEKRGKEIKPKK